MSDPMVEESEVKEDEVMLMVEGEVESEMSDPRVKDESLVKCIPERVSVEDEVMVKREEVMLEEKVT